MSGTGELFSFSLTFFQKLQKLKTHFEKKAIRSMRREEGGAETPGARFRGGEGRKEPLDLVLLFHFLFSRLFFFLQTLSFSHPPTPLFS
jgi:hypothetical protein